MIISIAANLHSLFAHAMLVFGFAVLVLKWRQALDVSVVLSFASVPLIPLGLLLLYAQGAEIFISCYGGTKFETESMQSRMLGPYSFAYFFHVFVVFSTQIFLEPETSEVRCRMSCGGAAELSFLTLCHPGEWGLLVSFPNRPTANRALNPSAKGVGFRS